LLEPLYPPRRAHAAAAAPSNKFDQLRRFVPAPSWHFLAWLWGDAHITWPAAFIGAFAGTHSHVFLDSVMHADMPPPLPLSDANALVVPDPG
jgi:hypothetical protein